MIATVLLVAAVATTPAVPTARAVVVTKAGRCARYAAVEVTPAVLESAHHVWLWSSSSAPQAIAPEQWGATTHVAGDVLLVRVPRRAEGRDQASLKLVAAPAEMWREVPERMLPTWEVPESGEVSVPRVRGGEWRVRLRGTRQGSCWYEVPPGQAAITIVPRPAQDLVVGVVDREGGAVKSAILRVFRGAQGRRGSGALLAMAESDGAGRIKLPAVPACGKLLLMVMAKGFAPVVTDALRARSPARVVLDPGAAIGGRFIDGEGAPIEGVEATVAYWASAELAFEIARRTASDADGRWKVDAIPRGRVVVSAEARGFVPFSTAETVEGEPLDLGSVSMARGLRVVVRVVDDRGQPIAGATVASGRRIVAVTDARGAAILEAVSPSGATRLRFEAEDHLAVETRLQPPFPEEVEIRLTRALVVTGRLVDPDGVPPPDGSVVVDEGGAFSISRVDGDGRFRLELRPQHEAVLRLRAPDVCEVEARVAAGSPGERRDLGEIVVSRGRVAVGRVLDELDGSPIGTARVWTPRFGPRGILAAWMLHDLVETGTGADGHFQLSGLGDGEALLRIDAPGYARAHVPLVPDDESNLYELGDVELGPGATVKVVCEDQACDGATARVDLRGEWLEIDMLDAPFEDDVALVQHVPPGAVTMSVLRGESLLCEKEITVPEGESELEVACEKRTTTVRGTVLVGGATSGRGVLTWSLPGGDRPGAIMTTLSPSGLPRQTAFRGGRPPVSVEVAGDGIFVTDALVPGEWSVVWYSGQGVPSAPKEVTIPEVDELELMLDFPGLGLSGVVVDGDQRPIPEARVRDLASGAVAVAAEDGSFRLSGLSAGAHRVQAFDRGRSSDEVTVTLTEDEEPPSVELVVDEEKRVSLTVTVVDREGAPAAGALLFVESDNGSLDVLSAGSDGVGEVELYPPYPSRVRPAAYFNGVWALGGWDPLEEARAGLSVAVGRSGELRVTSEESSGLVGIEAPLGWDLSRLLMRLGLLPTVAPERPLVVSGVPPGTYRVRLGVTSRQASVEAGEAAEVTLEE